METIFDKATALAGRLQEYVTNRISMIKLETADKSSKLIAVIIAVSIVSVFLMLSLMFLGLTAMVLLSEWTGSYYAGALIVAVIFLLLALLFWVRKDKLIRIPVLNAILKQLFHDEKDQ